MRKQKWTAILTAAVLTLTTGSSVVFAADKPVFSDIGDHWAKAAISEAVTLQVAGGYPNGTFLPDNLIKREEFYTLISNILTIKPHTSGTKLTFSDVEPDEWYIPTIQTAVAGKMTSGYPDGTFGVGRMMTRQEAAQVVSLIVPKTVTGTPAASVSTAKDKSAIGSWAYPAVDLMFQKGYMKGDNKKNFRPTNAITRAEAVQLLLQVKKHETVIGNAGSGTEPGTEIAPVTPKPPVDQNSVLVGKGCTNSHLTTAAGTLDVSAEALQKLPKGTFTEGNGTEKDPYQINTPQQLSHMRMHIKEGAHFKLMKDILFTEDLAVEQTKPGGQTTDWRAGNFEPIGTKEMPFKGVFDGNSHTISGVHIDSTLQEGLLPGTLKVDAAGLFGWIAPTGKVMNLRLSDMTVTNLGSYTGAIAGYCQGTLTDCNVESSVTVKGQLYTGGLVGYGENGITDCTGYAIVHGGASYTGGIAGYFYAGLQPINRCYGRGTVTGVNDTGGIVGGMAAQNNGLVAGYAIQSSYHYGTVMGQNGNAGGIVGRVDDSSGLVSLNKCVNRGNVQGMANSGGVVGHVQGQKVVLNECGNLGRVSGGNAGGITGMNEGLIQLCLNTGEIEAANNGGGIAGVQNDQKAKITKSYNEGTIGMEKKTTNAGGIVGQNDSLISYCYNASEVWGSSNAGGIAGKNGGRLLNIYNVGKIDGDSLKGSLAGRNQGTCTNGFWLSGTAENGMGGSDGGAKLVQVIQVNEEQLKGKQQVRVDEGDYVVDALNSLATTKVWLYVDGYDYPQLSELQ